MIKNLVLKQWKPVANAIVKNEKILLELTPAICRKVSQEFKNLIKSESMLKGTQPQQLETSSNKLILEKTSLYLPHEQDRNSIMSEVAYRISTVPWWVHQATFRLFSPWFMHSSCKYYWFADENGKGL